MSRNTPIFREGSGSFSEEKEPKRLFWIWVLGVDICNAQDPDSKKFLRRFFQKAAPFLD
jgi:hypothetical protein